MVRSAAGKMFHYPEEVRHAMSQLKEQPGVSLSFKLAPQLVTRDHIARVVD